jgi:hypothetical protein
MRNMQNLSSKHRIGAATAVSMQRKPVRAAPEDLAAQAVQDALNELAHIVSDRCFENPVALTQDRITAYALTLIRLRECASAAGFERLMNACDALAVTVSRLIDDRSCANREKCTVLTRFVVHAQEMIHMPADRAKHHILPIPDIRIASGRARVKRNARVSK